MTGETEYGLLGPLAVRRDGAQIPIPPGQQRVLLAALLLQAGRPARVDELGAERRDLDQGSVIQEDAGVAGLPVGRNPARNCRPRIAVHPHPRDPALPSLKEAPVNADFLSMVDYPLPDGLLLTVVEMAGNPGASRPHQRRVR